MNPKVSIILLTYNQIDYIDEAINSIIEQTYENWEHLLCPNFHFSTLHYDLCGIRIYDFWFLCFEYLDPFPEKSDFTYPNLNVKKIKQKRKKKKHL